MDNRDYWGNAFDLLRRGELFLLDHIPIAGRVVLGVRRDLLKSQQVTSDPYYV